MRAPLEDHSRRLARVAAEAGSPSRARALVHPSPLPSRRSPRALSGAAATAVAAFCVCVCVFLCVCGGGGRAHAHCALRARSLDAAAAVAVSPSGAHALSLLPATRRLYPRGARFRGRYPPATVPAPRTRGSEGERARERRPQEGGAAAAIAREGGRERASEQGESWRLRGAERGGRRAERARRARFPGSPTPLPRALPAP